MRTRATHRPRLTVRAAALDYAVPALAALAAGWSYLDNFLRPTFAGDQGVRLERAAEIVVGVGERVWLPFLQLHLRLLHALRAPIELYLAVPWLYMSALLVLLTVLCRALLPTRREALVASALLAVAVVGGAFNWLGRSLYQEVIVLPLFAALVALHHLAPERRRLFLSLVAVGLLTREIFWIWWLALAVVEWRRSPGRRAATAALGIIPALWLLATRQPPTLGRNRAEEVEMFAGLAGRAAGLLELLAAESLLVGTGLLVAAAGLVAWRRGVGALSWRRFHLFSLLSLALFCGYLLLFDPWRATPGNPRQLVPLYAHLLVAAIVIWRDVARLDSRAAWAGRTLVVAALLSMVKIGAVSVALADAPVRGTQGWEPARLARSAATDDWRRELAAAVATRRTAAGGDLTVAFVEVPTADYRKYLVAPLLYERRLRVAAGEALPAADLAIVPAGRVPSGWTALHRLRLRAGSEWDLAAPEASR